MNIPPTIVYDPAVDVIRPCVYFLMRRNRIVFIGSTNRMAERRMELRRQKFHGCTIRLFYTTTRGMALDWEQFLVQQMEPELNVKLPRSGQRLTEPPLSAVVSASEHFNGYAKPAVL